MSGFPGSPCKIVGCLNEIGGLSDEPILLDSAVSLGQADLSLDRDGKLKVSNLGSSGCDGVSIAHSGGSGADADVAWESAAPINPLDGHVTVLKAHGGGGGGAGGAIWLSFTGNDTDFDMAADFSALGSDPVTLNIYDEGRLIDTVNCEPDTLVPWSLHVSAVPDYFTTVVGHPDGRTRLLAGLPPGTTYVNDAGPPTRMNKAELIEAVYNGPAAAQFTEILSMSLMASGTPSLTITSAGAGSGLTSVDDTPQASSLSLQSPSPNPFNPRTEIAYEVRRDGAFSLQIFDVRGQLVRDLFTGYRSAGQYRETWDGLDDMGQHVASGTYLFQLSGHEGRQSRKAVLIR